jgi:hypothetical protein
VPLLLLLPLGLLLVLLLLLLLLGRDSMWDGSCQSKSAADDV